MNTYNNKKFYTIEKCRENIKPRELDTNKGSYGRVGIVAGSQGMSGSVCLTSNSCLRTGTGLVYTIVPYSILDIVSIKLTECIIKSSKNENNHNNFFTMESIIDIQNAVNICDCIVLGPGIGTDNETKLVVNHLLLTYEKPIILDADGLNCICGNIEILKKRKAPTIITPHPKEFERLLEHSNVNYKDKVETTVEFSKEYNVITLLKGYNTVISNINGEYYINPTGNPGMATAGSGDVLAGIIASLVGQGIDLFNSTCCGAYLHGLAGDFAANEIGQYSLIASDIIAYIGRAFKSVLKQE